MFHTHRSTSGGALKNVTPKGTVVKVSSTLDASSGKKYLLDGSDETCWSSAQGLPQYVHLTFPSLLSASHLSLTFQGGFSSSSVAIYLAVDKREKEVDEQQMKSLELVFGGRVWPVDKNAKQIFEIPIPEAISPPTSPTQPAAAVLSAVATTDAPMPPSDSEIPWIKEIKLVFEKSADPWGRIVVYDLQLLG